MRYLSVYILLFFLSACSTADQPCLESKSNPCLAGYYVYASDSTGQRSKYVLSTYGTTVVLRNQSRLDTLIHWGQSRTSTSVPLSPFLDSMEFEVYLDSFQSTEDWVRVIYEPDERFINLECGIGFEYKIRQVRHSRFKIDSVLIVDSVMQLNNSDENLQIIYF